MKRLLIFGLWLWLFGSGSYLRADSLEDLAKDFWQWRANEQPVSSDDIARIERPAAWIPDWSAASVEKYRRELNELEGRWKRLDTSHTSVPEQIDYRLIGSALARVRWELDRTRMWQRNPEFYVQQTAGAYFNLLLQPPPFNGTRSRQIVAVLRSVPATIEAAEQNLNQPAAPFARLAIAELENFAARLQKSASALKPQMDATSGEQVASTAATASAALEQYRQWLVEKLPTMSNQTAAGRENYEFFLREVALLPFTPEQLLEMGHLEWARSVASQVYEEHRNAGAPELHMFSNESEEMEREKVDELAVRKFLERKQILSVPPWVQHYLYLAIPAYLDPLGDLGELDDLTGPGQLDQNGIRYIASPGPQLGYFAFTQARDPRGLIVHEGVPGHYFQLALGWKNDDPIRRHYYDSGANEGIGFYAEEMMLHAGLFDDSPRSREFIWNFMRLRALRVEVDVKLALGEFSIEQAAKYLMETVPMDARTANAEAAFFASTPGQAISYQIGKIQIYQFLADAQRQQGKKFNLRAFHDFVWQNGNVPIGLQRWELLSLKDGVPQ
jgi:uncharacterized protein (DUF885 family)